MVSLTLYASNLMNKKTNFEEHNNFGFNKVTAISLIYRSVLSLFSEGNGALLEKHGALKFTLV